MCLAIPGKILKIEGENASVDYGGIRKGANVSLIDAKVGEWVLVHVGFAIQKVDEDVAHEAYRLLSEVELKEGGLSGAELKDD